MSEVIDQRTVEMRFDNQNFEKNVESSIDLIEKLKRNLNFNDTKKEFESFENMFDHLTSKIGSSSFRTNFTEGIKNDLEALSKFGKDLAIVKEIEGIYGSLLNTGKNVIKSMSGINQMTEGWGKYNKKVASVKTIMNATGKSIDEVSRALNKLNWYTDETSYDFADMVNNIGKFTSSGVKLEDAVSAMQGISNWAATSGQGKGEAARVMYNLSQAMSLGSVKMQDWKSVELANMGTKEFKETVIQTAVELGKLKKVGDDYYTTIGKKQKVTVETFGSTLSTGWFDSELLTTTLKRYSEFTDKVYEFIQEQHKLNPEEDLLTVDKAIERMKELGMEVDETGYKWFLSAQEAKSFTDAIDSLKDALSTGWMNTFELIFGNYEQAAELWTDLANTLYDTFATPIANQVDFLEKTLTSSYSKLKNEIIAAGLSVEKFETKIYDVAKAKQEDKDALDALIAEYGTLSKALDSGKVPTEWITSAIDELTKSAGEAEKVTPTLEEVQKIVKDTWAGKYGVGQERIDQYKKLGYSAESLQKLVLLYTKKGKIELEDLADVGIEAGEAYSDAWGDFVEGNKELIDSLDEMSGRQMLVGGITNAVKSGLMAFASFRDGINDAFKISPDTVKNGLKHFYEITDMFKITEKGAQRLREFTTALFSPLKSMGVVAKKFLDPILGFDEMKEPLQNFRNWLVDSFMEVDVFAQKVSRVFKGLENSKYVNKAVTKFSNAFNGFINDTSKKFSSYKKNFDETIGGTYVGRDLIRYSNAFKTFWKSIKTPESNPFDTLIEVGKRVKKLWERNHGEELTFSNLFSDWWEGTKASSGFLKGLDKVWSDIKIGFTNFENKIKNSKFVKKIGETFSKIFKKDEIEQQYPNWIKASAKSNPISNYLSNIFGNLSNLKDKITILKDPGSLFKSFKENLEVLFLGFDSIIPSLNNAKNVFSSVLKSGKGIAEALKSGYKEFFYSFAENLTGGIFDRNNKNSLVNAQQLFIGNWRDNFHVFVERLKTSADKIIEKASSKIKVSKVGELIEKYTNLKKNGFKMPNYRDLLDSLYNNIWKPIDAIDRMHGDTGDKKSILSFIPGFDAIGNLLKKYNIDLGAILKSIAEKVNSSVPTIVNGIKHLVDFVSPLLKELLESFAKTFKFSDLPPFLTALATFRFSSVGKSISGFFDSLKKSTDNFSISGEITKTCQGIAEAFTPLMEEKKNLRARTVLAYAASIGILAASIVAIAQVPVEDLKKAGIVVGAITVVIGAMIFLVGRLNDISFSVSIGSAGQIFKIVALIVAISIAMLNAGKAAKAISEAVDNLIPAIEKLSDLAAMKPQFERGLNAVIDLILALGAGSGLAGLGLGNLFGGPALVILAMAKSISMLYDSLVKIMVLSQLDETALDKAIDNIGEIFMKLGQATFVSGFLQSSNIFGAIGRVMTMLSLVAAIKILQNNIVELSKIPPNELESAVEGIKGLLSSLGSAAFWSGLTGSIGSAATIYAIGSALKNIVSVIDQIMHISANQKRFDEARAIVTGIITFMSGAVLALGIANRLGAGVSIGQAASVFAFGIAIKMIADTMSSLGEMNTERMRVAEEGIVAIGLVLAGMVGLIGLFTKLSTKNITNSHLNILSNAVLIFSLGNAVNTMANSIIGLSKLNKEDLEKGEGALIAIALSLNSLILASAAIKDSKKIGTGISFAAIGVGILIIGKTLEQLGKMDDGELAKGETAVFALAGVMSACIAVMNIGAKAPSWTNAVNIAALAGAIWVLADVAKTFGDMNGNQLKKAGAAITILLGILTVISRVALPNVGTKGSLFNAASLLIITGAVILLAQMSKTFADMEWGELGRAGAGLGGLVTAVLALSLISRIISKVSVGSVAKLGLIVAEILAIMAVIGQIFSISFFSNGIDKFGDLLGQLGSAIGKFLGNLAGSASESFANSLPSVGSSLAQFADNAKPFFDMIRDLNGINVGAILLSIVSAQTIADINTFMERLVDPFHTNKDKYASLKEFGSALGEMAPSLALFFGATEGADASKIGAVADSLYTMSKIARVQSQLGVSEEYNPMADFASKIEEASGNIKSAVDALNGLPALTDNAETVMDSLIRLANTDFGKRGIDIEGSSFGLTVGGEKGLLDFEHSGFKIIVDFGTSLEEYATQLERAWTQINSFVEEANSISIETIEDNDGKITKVEKLAQMLGAWGAIQFNWKFDFSDIAEKLLGGVGYFKTFVDTLNQEDYALPDKEKWKGFVQCIKDLAEIQMPYKSVNDLSVTFSDLVGAYDIGLDKFDELVEHIDQQDEKGNIDKISNIVSIFDAAKEIDLSKLAGVPEKIASFVTNLNSALGDTTIDENISTTIKGIADLISTNYIGDLGFSEACTDITSGLSKLAASKKEGTDGALDYDAANSVATWFDQFVWWLLRFQSEVKIIDDTANDIHTDFGQKLAQIINDVNNGFATLKDPGLKVTKITKLFESFKTLSDLAKDEKGFESIEPTLNIFQLAMTLLGDAIDSFRPDMEYTEFDRYMSFIEGLGEKKGIFEKAAESLNAFSVNVPQLTALTGFFTSLKGFKIEGKSKGENWYKSILQEMFPKNYEDINAKIAGDFTDIAMDLSLMSKILEEKVDFDELDTITAKLISFSNALSNIRTTSTEGIANKFNEFITAINKAILGDNSKEYPGIKNYGDKLSQFDSISVIFDSLSEWQMLGLKDVVPGILTSITESINAFDYEPSKITVLKEAMKGIREALDILEGGNNPQGASPDNSGIKNATRIVGLGTVERKRVSKVYQLSDKIFNSPYFYGPHHTGPEDEDISEDVNNAFEKVDTSVIVETIANSIMKNAFAIAPAINELVRMMAETLDLFMDKFYDAGRNINDKIAAGLIENPAATTNAAILATQMLSKLSEAAFQYGENNEFVNALAEGLLTEDNKNFIQNAVKELFTGDEEGTGLTDVINNSIQPLLGISDAGSNLGSDFFSSLIKSFLAAYEEYSPQLEIIAGAVNSVISGSVPDGYGLGYNFMAQLAAGLAAGAADFDFGGFGVGVAQDFNNGATGPDGWQIASPSKVFRKYGHYISEGLMIGINDYANLVRESGISFADTFSNATRDSLQIASPSKVFYEIGEYVVDGFVNAISNDSQRAANAVSSMAELSVDEIYNLIGMLDKSNGPIKYKGRLYTKSDITRLREYAAALQNVNREEEKAEKGGFSGGLEEASKAGGGGGGGGSGEGSETKKKKYKIGDTEVELSDEQIKELEKALVEANGDTIKFLTYTFKTGDVQEFFKNNKSTLEKILDWTGLSNLFKDGTEPVIEMDGKKGIKGGVKVNTLGGPNFATKFTKGFESFKDKQKKESNSDVTNVTNNYNYNQEINTTKPVSASEVWRHSSNVFNLMKQTQ